MVFSLPLKSKRRWVGRARYKTTRLPISAPREVSRKWSVPSRTHCPIFAALDGYQKDAVRFFFANPYGCAGLFFEQGTGKTWIAAAIAEQLCNQGFEGMFVVPLSNKETTWLKLLKEYLDCYTNWGDFLEAPTPKVFVCHYEAIPKQTLKHWFTFICYDESQRLKQRQSKQSKFAGRLSGQATYRLILSGTPIEKKPQDLWAQMRFLAPWVLQHWDDFEARWLEPIDIDLSKYDPESITYQRMFIAYLKKKRKQQFRAELMPEFLELLRPYCWRVNADDVLDLPPLTHIPVSVSMLGAQRRLYDTIEQDWVTELGGRRITAGLKGPRVNKLQQICGGWVKDDDGKAMSVGRAKLRKLRAIVAKAELPVVICCRFIAEVEGIAEVLRANGLVGAMLYGKTKKLRAEIQETFQRGDLDFLVCQQRTGGVGIDLFRSHVLVLYSITHSSIDYEQMIKRLHRRGQKKPVSVYSIYAKNSIDEDVILSLIGKHKVVEQVLSGLKRRKWQSPLPRTRSRSRHPRRLRPMSTMSTLSPRSSKSSRHRPG